MKTDTLIDLPTKSFLEEISLSELPAFADRIAKTLLKAEDKEKVVLLYGDLGAGKTTFVKSFVKAICQNQHVALNDEVTSPTFNLLNIYEIGTLKVFHYDLYRVEHVNELKELDIDGAISLGIVIIEWPETAAKANLLPKKSLNITITQTPTNDKRMFMVADF